MPSADRAESLYREAVAARDAADFRSLHALARKLLAAAESENDRRYQALGHLMLGIALSLRNDGASSQRSLRRAREIFKAIGDTTGEGRAMMSMGAVALDIDLDADAARALYDECLPMMRRSGDRQQYAIALGNVGEIDRLEGDYAAALRHAGEALEIFRELGEHARAAWQLTNMAHYHLLSRRSNHEVAVSHLLEAFEELRADPNPRWTAWYFDVWIILAASSQQWETVALLRAFVERYRDENEVPRLQATLPWLSAPFEQVWKALPEERLDELLLEGEALTVSAAHELALRSVAAVERAT
jgi:tetratricopeptide (TPR) repeat protein